MNDTNKCKETLEQIERWIDHLDTQLRNSNISSEVKIFHVGRTIGKIEDELDAYRSEEK